MRFTGIPAAAIAGALLAVCFAGCGGERAHYVTIGAGGVTGVYYPVGGAIARYINDDPDAGLRASVEATGGSVFNINAVLNGDLDFGIAQADRQYQAVHGLAEWADRGPQEDLRAVASLYTEMVTLVAAADAGIETLEDLRGKRVNLGNPGSGTRINAIQALEAAGIDWENDLNAQGVTSAESAKLLQDDRIDAYFFTAGHPAGSFMEATAGRRQVRFVAITGMDALIAEAPFYSEARIPIAPYPSALNEEDVPTIGVKTTLVTHAGTPDAVVHALLRVLTDNFEAFRGQHSVLEEMSLEAMPKGLFAPLHPGAERFYREAGLL